MTVETSTRLTYEDYLLLPNDGRRHEIIDGEHYVNPAPAPKHQIVSMNLSGTLWQYATRESAGQVITAPCDVILGPDDVLQPDILFVKSQRTDIITGRGIEGAPDLVVEILSPSSAARRFDEGVKLKRYDRFGVAEYWIVNPDDAWIKVYRRSERGLSLVDQIASGSITSPLFPGLSLPLEDIFPQ